MLLPGAQGFQERLPLLPACCLPSDSSPGQGPLSSALSNLPSLLTHLILILQLYCMLLYHHSAPQRSSWSLVFPFPALLETIEKDSTFSCCSCCLRQHDGEYLASPDHFSWSFQHGGRFHPSTFHTSILKKKSEFRLMMTFFEVYLIDLHHILGTGLPRMYLGKHSFLNKNCCSCFFFPLLILLVCIGLMWLCVSEFTAQCL